MVRPLKVVGAKLTGLWFNSLKPGLDTSLRARLMDFLVKKV